MNALSRTSVTCRTRSAMASPNELSIAIILKTVKASFVVSSIVLIDIESAILRRPFGLVPTKPPFGFSGMILRLFRVIGVFQMQLIRSVLPLTHLREKESESDLA